MIGCVVVGFDVFPEAILISAQQVVGPQKAICAIPLSEGEQLEKQREAIQDAIGMVDQGHGIIIFVDYLDSDAGHIMRSIQRNLDVDVISGVNIPMLVKFFQKRNSSNLEEILTIVRDEGRKGINWRSP